MTQQIPQADKQNSMNFANRFMGVIYRPQTVMAFLKNNPFILFGIISSLFAAVVYYGVNYSLFVEYTKETALNSETTLDQQITNTLISTPLLSVFYWIFLTGLTFLLVKLFKGTGKFKQFLAVYSYGYVIVWISFLVYYIISLFTNSLFPDLSLAGLFAQSLSGMEETFLYGFLKGIDLFGVWYFVIVYQGIKVVSELTKGKSILITLIVALLVISLAAFAA